MASIKKLDERRYKITVSNGYRPNDKKISKAKTIQVPFGVPKRGIGQYVAHAAEELERSFKTGYAEDGEMTFEEFASRWLNRQTKYAPSTIAAYQRMLEVVYPMIGGIRLNKLRPMALENMLSELRKRKHHGKHINESTAQRYLSVVSAVLSDAKRNEIIEKNPARMLDLPTPQRTVQRIPTRSEVEKLLDALAKEPRHYRLFYLLSMYTGCRRGELCALQWSDFTGTQNGLLLTVSRSRSSVPGKGIVEGTTKNGKSREVYLSSDLRGILLAYKRRKQMEADKQRRKLSPYLFTDEQGQLIHPDTFTKRLRKIYDAIGFPREYRRECAYITETYDQRQLTADDFLFRRQGAQLPMTPTTFTYRFKLILKKNGLPQELNVHSLRHTAASLMIAGGTDVATVAGILGHSQPSTTLDIYTHAFDKNKKAASAELQGMLEI